MLLKIFLIFVTCFSANAGSFLEFDLPSYTKHHNQVERSASVLLEEQPDEVNELFKMDRFLCRSHAIVNTLLLSGVLCFSPVSGLHCSTPESVISLSGLYLGWCTIIYSALSVDASKACREAQGLAVKNTLREFVLFHRNQACINLFASACLFAGGFAETPATAYVFGGIFLVSAVGNSFFFV